MSAYSDWKCGALSDKDYAYFDQLDSDGPGDEDDEEETEDDFDDF